MHGVAISRQDSRLEDRQWEIEKQKKKSIKIVIILTLFFQRKKRYFCMIFSNPTGLKLKHKILLLNVLNRYHGTIACAKLSKAQTDSSV